MKVPIKDQMLLLVVYLLLSVSSALNQPSTCNLRASSNVDLQLSLLRDNIHLIQENMNLKLENMHSCSSQDFKAEIDQLRETICILEEAVKNITNQQFPINNSCPGSDPSQPASSCQQVLSCNASSLSGDYWIASGNGSVGSHYCKMNRACGGIDGGWMRVAMVDMSKDDTTCPNMLTERAHPGKRLCGIGIDDGCSEVFFNTDVRFDQVCGKIIAFQFGTPDSFGQHPVQAGRTIDENYVDGISLTYSSNPRKHIWSFAAALDEAGTYAYDNCPCTKIDMASSATPPPDFVGNDYFCDTGDKDKNLVYHLFSDDPLWDGTGCGPANTCCSLNNPPWFFKQLEYPTISDIEMRVCINEGRVNEDIRIKQIEIYIR